MKVFVENIFKLDVDPQAWVNRHEGVEVLMSNRGWRWNRQRLLKAIDLSGQLPWIAWETMLTIFGSHAHAIARECEQLVGEPITDPEPTPRREKRGGRFTLEATVSLNKFREKMAAQAAKRSRRRPRPEA